MRVNKEKHTELVKHVKQLLKVNSFALLKGRLSMEYVNLLFSHDSFTTCLDRAKIDQNIYLNTFFIDILQAPVIFQKKELIHDFDINGKYFFRFNVNHECSVSIRPEQCDLTYLDIIESKAMRIKPLHDITYNIFKYQMS